MISDEIQPGDQLINDGEVVYTVEEVSPQPPLMKVVVRYADGGNGVRLFELDTEVPLIRPPS